MEESNHASTRFKHFRSRLMQFFLTYQTIPSPSKQSHLCSALEADCRVIVLSQVNSSMRGMHARKPVLKLNGQAKLLNANGARQAKAVFDQSTDPLATQRSFSSLNEKRDQNFGAEPYSTTRMLESHVGQVNRNGGSFPPGTARRASHEGHDMRRFVSIRHSFGPRGYCLDSSSSSSSSSSDSVAGARGVLNRRTSNASANRT